MNLFKHCHFKYDVIIWVVRWYCKYVISYRDLEKMLTERSRDNPTIYHWVQYYAPNWKLKLVLSLENG